MTQAMHSPRNPKVDKMSDFADIPDKVVGVAAKLGTTDRTMFAFLLIVGIVVLGMILYWHRQSQLSMEQLFREVVKANTEALVKVSVALERFERNSK